jgi:WD40-like Beta Propeller Repeat
LRGKICLSFWVLILAVLTFSSCQGTINYPSPSISALSPNNIAAGQPPFTLTVTGSNFTPASLIEWNNQPLQSIFQNTSTMTALISPSLIQNPGSVPVTVFTPQPGGGVANPVLNFVINPTTSQIPLISYINPTSVLAGGAAPSIYVYGSNFTFLSTVSVNGGNRSTNYIGPTTLFASLNPDDLDTAATLQIMVVNPPPGGGSSNPVSLQVTNPVPTITSTTPIAIEATTSTTPVVLTVAGKSFVPNSYIQINGVARTTLFAGSTSLSTTLTEADVSTGGTDQVVVVNPAPGGGTSTIFPISVNPTSTVGLPVLLDLGANGVVANAGICGTTCTGAVPTTLTAGPSISSNGQEVAFASLSNNLIANQGNTNTSSEIYLRATCLSLSATCTAKTTVISLTSAGGTSNGASWEPSIDSGAAHVAFTSTATNLVTTTSVPSGTKQVYWSPVCTSTTACFTGNGPATTLVSTSADGITPGNGDSFNPIISPDGQFVAFVSLATNLVSGITFDGVTPQVYIRATCGGITSTACVPTTYLVSTPNVTLPFTIPGNGASTHPSVSSDGLFVSFTSSATNLGATAPNPAGQQEVFVRSTCVTTISSSTNACAPITSLISTPDGTTPAAGPSGDPAISSDGRFVAFDSTATNLGVASGGVQEIYVRDTCTGANTINVCTAPSTILVSTLDGTTPANGLSEHPSISQCSGAGTCTTGQFVAFSSLSSNLGLNISNGTENVFVRNTCLNIAITVTTPCTTGTTLASQPAGTTPPPSDGNSIKPAVSGDGHSVAFISFAHNLVPFPTSGFQDVFLAATQF